MVNTIVYSHPCLGNEALNTPIHELKEKAMSPYIPFIDNSLMKCVSSIKHFSMDGH